MATKAMVETQKVSNPQREAIEGRFDSFRAYQQKVSNPQREAIEAGCGKTFAAEEIAFPILRGRLLKWQQRVQRVWSEKFPILRGRLLKMVVSHRNLRRNQFPILRGRLLKTSRKNRNRKNRKFPILRGRLLKQKTTDIDIRHEFVSNPQREAIEAFQKPQ